MILDITITQYPVLRSIDTDGGWSPLTLLLLFLWTAGLFCSLFLRWIPWRTRIWIGGSIFLNLICLAILMSYTPLILRMAASSLPLETLLWYESLLRYALGGTCVASLLLLIIALFNWKRASAKPGTPERNAVTAS